MRLYWVGLLSIVLCLGQNCASTILDSLGNGDSTDGSNDGGDGSSDTIEGIPEGVYSGTRTTDFSMDNLSDAYDPETSHAEVRVSYGFDGDGKLLRGDGEPLAVGNTLTTNTQLGTIVETVTNVVVATHFYRYDTAATMTMQGQAGLVWNFAGSGVYTYRYSGGHVLYDGNLEMTSDVAGGVSYDAIWTASATLDD